MTEMLAVLIELDCFGKPRATDLLRTTVAGVPGVRRSLTAVHPEPCDPPVLLLQASSDKSGVSASQYLSPEVSMLIIRYCALVRAARPSLTS